MKSYLQFINEKYIHYSIGTLNNCIIDPLVDLKDYVYDESPKSADYVTRYLKSKINCLIKVYHGTSPDIDLTDGLKTTKINTKKSFQSEVGYTYFSIYPDSAKMFGDMAYGINNAQIYEILLPIIYILPDKDQLFNVRQSKDIWIKDTIGYSIVYGHGCRVKGDIPPYMMKKI